MDAICEGLAGNLQGNSDWPLNVLTNPPKGRYKLRQQRNVNTTKSNMKAVNYIVIAASVVAIIAASEGHPKPEEATEHRESESHKKEPTDEEIQKCKVIERAKKNEHHEDGGIIHWFKNLFSLNHDKKKKVHVQGGEHKEGEHHQAVPAKKGDTDADEKEEKEKVKEREKEKEKSTEGKQGEKVASPGQTEHPVVSAGEKSEEHSQGKKEGKKEEKPGSDSAGPSLSPRSSHAHEKTVEEVITEGKAQEKKQTVEGGGDTAAGESSASTSCSKT